MVPGEYGAKEDFWKRDRKATGDWRKLQSEDFHALYSSSHTIRVIKYRRWTGHVVRMGEKRNVMLMGNLMKRENLNGLGVDGRILKWILNKVEGMARI